MNINLDFDISILNILSLFVLSCSYPLSPCAVIAMTVIIRWKNLCFYTMFKCNLPKAAFPWESTEIMISPHLTIYPSAVPTITFQHFARQQNLNNNYNPFSSNYTIFVWSVWRKLLWWLNNYYGLIIIAWVTQHWFHFLVLYICDTDP